MAWGQTVAGATLFSSRFDFSWLGPVFENDSSEEVVRVNNRHLKVKQPLTCHSSGALRLLILKF